MLVSAFLAILAVLCCFLSLVFGAAAGDRLMKNDKHGFLLGAFTFFLLQMLMAIAIVGAV